MKEQFPGHFFQVDENHAIWQDCIFIMDANILLNLYRYSDETRDSLLATLEKLKDRIWIPNRAASEYLENRLAVIREQQQKYEKTVSEIDSLQKALENSRQHPFISKDTLSSLNKSFDSAKEDLNKNKSVHIARLNFDEIKQKISEIFDGRVGLAESEKHIESVIEEGKIRYQEKIPPGYKDAKKESGEDTLKARARPYGDLLIWKSILNKGKTEDRSVIFITDDGKEDWWLRFDGKTIGPRPELITEFKETTGKDFYMYLPDRFLSFSSKINNEALSEDVLKEIRDSRIEKQKKLKDAEIAKKYFTSTWITGNDEELDGLDQELRDEISYIKEQTHSLLMYRKSLWIERENLRAKISSLQSHLHDTWKGRFPSGDDLDDDEEALAIKTQLYSFDESIADIDEKILQLERRLASIYTLFNSGHGGAGSRKQHNNS